VEFRILGPLEIIGSGGPVALRGVKRRGLVAYLLVHAGEAVPLDRLVEDLWGEGASSGARGTVQTYLSQLRKLLADGSGSSLETRPGGYTLAVPADSFDARCFERLCVQAAAEPDAARRLALVDEALGLWRCEAIANGYAPHPFVSTAVHDPSRRAAQQRGKRPGSRVGGRRVFSCRGGVPDLRRFPPGATAVPFDISPNHLGFDRSSEVENRFTLRFSMHRPRCLDEPRVESHSKVIHPRVSAMSAQLEGTGHT
jgi:DNA-binding winged helix-turn-helix (wHTH) protein